MPSQDTIARAKSLSMNKSVSNSIMVNVMARNVLMVEDMFKNMLLVQQLKKLKPKLKANLNSTRFFNKDRT